MINPNTSAAAFPVTQLLTDGFPHRSSADLRQKQLMQISELSTKNPITNKTTVSTGRNDEHQHHVRYFPGIAKSNCSRLRKNTEEDSPSAPASYRSESSTLLACGSSYVGGVLGKRQRYEPVLIQFQFAWQFGSPIPTEGSP